MIKEIKVLPRVHIGARGSPPKVFVLECDWCHLFFERPCTKEYRDKHQHYCGPGCWYKSSRGEQGSRGCEMVTKSCGYCSALITKRVSQTLGREHLFCDRKCFSEYKKIYQHPNTIEALKRTAADPEFRAFMSEHTKQRLARDGHPWQDRHHTDESRAKMRESGVGKHDGALNGMFERGHTEQSRAQMSDTRTKLMIAGQMPYGRNNHVSGWHTSSKGNLGMKMFYRSSWERDMMLHLDSNDDVLSYGYECVRIPYYDIDNHKRNYVPDFIITHSDGRRVLVEIKPKQFLNNVKTILKAEAARTYCSNNGIDVYELLTGEDLRSRQIIK